MTRVTQGSGETESTVVVAGLRTVADGVRELTLVPSNGTPLPSWAPGAHIDLILDDGLVRQYSLCGPVEDHDHWRVAFLREPEGTGVSGYVHDRVEVV